MLPVSFSGSVYCWLPVCFCSALRCKESRMLSWYATKTYRSYLGLCYIEDPLLWRLATVFTAFGFHLLSLSFSRNSQSPTTHIYISYFDKGNVIRRFRVRMCVSYFFNWLNFEHPHSTLRLMKNKFNKIDRQEGEAFTDQSPLH